MGLALCRMGMAQSQAGCARILYWNRSSFQGSAELLYPRLSQ